MWWWNWVQKAKCRSTDSPFERAIDAEDCLIDLPPDKSGAIKSTPVPELWAPLQAVKRKPFCREFVPVTCHPLVRYDAHPLMGALGRTQMAERWKTLGESEKELPQPKWWMSKGFTAGPASPWALDQVCLASRETPLLNRR